MKKSILLIIVPWIIFYLCGSFINWNMNPGTWEMVARAVMSFFSLVSSILIFIWQCYPEAYKNIKTNQ